MLNSAIKAKKLSVLFNGRNGTKEVNILELDKQAEEAKGVHFQYQDVDKIIKFNSCQCWNLEEMFKYLKHGKMKSDDEILFQGKLNAMWIKFAFFNHSCDENTDRFSIGDILFVKAKKAIKKGEELTTLYIPFDMPYPDKQRKLSWYQFKCTCELCTKTLALPMEVKQLLNSLWKELMNKDKKEETIQRKVVLYQDIYPKIMEKLESERFYLAELHMLQQELMIIYCS
jgi:SET domain